MNCLTKLFQQKRRRIGYILAFSGPMISKRDSSDSLYPDKTITESILCLGIANGFMESSRFKEALEYLKIAKLKNNKKLYPQIEMKINHFINECKEEL